MRSNTFRPRMTEVNFQPVFRRWVQANLGIEKVVKVEANFRFLALGSL